MKNRCDIDKKYTWDLDVIYSDMNSVDKDYDKAKKLIKKLGSFEKKMIVNISNFYKTIKLYFDIDRVVTKLSIYTSLSFDLDTSDNSKQELSEKVSNLRSDFSKCSYFIVPSILKLDNKTYDLLGLATFFTVGKDEVRAWTFKKGSKAPECAGIIHSDFEKGFIKAEVMSYNDLVNAGSELKVRELGKARIEGKEYIMQDGDICHFRFNV